ncbi:MAG: methyltransferase domain-containing protein [Verrucomicrobia bacterium]|nr:methyltransferase domain-containing protein [Verrucomicrobiota bacterium]MDE3099509.1 class I SAM-dependent methyltransferase [Verrucomicrobiota bacterium]
MPLKTWTHCRTCGNPHLKPIIDLGDQPLSGVFPRPDKPDPSISPLQLVRCDVEAMPGACGLVQLRHTAELNEMYGTTYGYYSSISPTMVSHLEGKVRGLVELAKPKPGDVVLDIGCNDGTLLNAYGAGAGLVRIGMDPSSKKFAAHFQPDIRVVYDFFNEKGARSLIGGKDCKIITSIAMFYDLDDPMSFIRDIRALLARDGVWALELSYLPLLLKQLTYDQVCHEHVTYLGLRQMDWMMKKCGLQILDVSFNDVNGGSFYIIAGRQDGPFRPKSAEIQKLIDDEAVLDADEPFSRLRNRILTHRDDVRGFFEMAKKAGKKVYGYGASTKGNIVLNYCGIGPDQIAAIGDRNPEKDGLVTPGMRIPIISHEKLRDLQPEYLFVLIWHFRKEVIRDEIAFLKKGCKMVFDLPRLHVVDGANYERYLERSFEDLAYSL